jgi:MAF protein
MTQTTLILASNSPRRKQLLSLFGRTFQVIPADIDERQHSGEAPQTYVQRMAREKAGVISAAHPEARVIAADTIVVDGDRILGKPADPDEARQTLMQLRGRTHEVMTGLTVVDGPGGRTLDDLCRTDVPMRDYSPAEVEAYIASGDPFDKAGGYAIQHEGFHPVVGMRGCFASVMGFPLCHLARVLHQLAVPAPEDIPQRCQDFLAYDCPVFRSILGRY